MSLYMRGKWLSSFLWKILFHFLTDKHKLIFHEFLTASVHRIMMSYYSAIRRTWWKFFFFVLLELIIQRRIVLIHKENYSYTDINEYTGTQYCIIRRGTKSQHRQASFSLPEQCHYIQTAASSLTRGIIDRIALMALICGRGEADEPFCKTGFIIFTWFFEGLHIGTPVRFFLQGNFSKC